MKPTSPSFDPLDALAADRAHASAAGERCAALWPLLAVPAGALSAEDRAAAAAHFGRCARCRAVAMEVWLDGDVAPLEVATAAVIPVAAARRARHRWPRTGAMAAMALATVAAAATTVAVWSRRDPSTSPAVSGPPAPAADASLAVVVAHLGTEVGMDHDGLSQAVRDAVATLPGDAHVAVRSFDGRERRAITVVEEAAAMLRTIPASRRVLLILGNGCDARDDGGGDPDSPRHRSTLDELDALRRRYLAAGLELRTVYQSDDDTLACSDVLRALDPAMIALDAPAQLPRLLPALMQPRPAP